MRVLLGVSVLEWCGSGVGVVWKWCGSGVEVFWSGVEVVWKCCGSVAEGGGSVAEVSCEFRNFVTESELFQDRPA